MGPYRKGEAEGTPPQKNGLLGALQGTPYRKGPYRGGPIGGRPFPGATGVPIGEAL